MNLASIVINNIIAIVFMCVVLINLSQHNRRGFLDENIFLWLIISSIIAAVIEVLSFVFIGKNFVGAYMLNRIFNAMLYIVEIVPQLLWIAYVDYKIFNDEKSLRRRMAKLAIPAGIVCILSILSINFDIMFKITSDNIYKRTPMVIIPVICLVFYIAYTVVMVLANKKNIHRYWFMPIVIFILPVIIGTSLQMAMYGYSFIWVSMSISVVIIYVNVQNEKSCIDGLTGLYNRIYMDYYLQNECSKSMGDYTFAGIMMDIDRFKSINDTYGHTVGDDALKNVGKILHACTRYSDFATRYGGDEFVVFIKVKNEIDILNFMEKIKKSVDSFNLAATDKQYTLSLSMGYSVYRGENDTVDSFLNRMDKAMYYIKNAKKQNEI